MSILLFLVGGFFVLVALSRAFHMRPRDQRFKSGYKWNEAAMPFKQRIYWLGGALLIVIVMLLINDAIFK